jgi:hypothetical protein
MRLIRTSQPPCGIDFADLLAGFFVLVSACMAIILLSQQITEFKWEQAARAAFYARMPAPVYIAASVNLAGREQLINEVALTILTLIIEVLLIWQVRSRVWRVQAWLSPARGSIASYVSGELQAIRQSAGRLAEFRQGGPPSEFRDLAHSDVNLHYFDEQSLEYREFDNFGSQELRARAEACFRLARGAVSRSLAEELEVLGEGFLRDADELESQYHSTELV